MTYEIIPAFGLKPVSDVAIERPIAEITEEDYCYSTDGIDCPPDSPDHLNGHNAIPLAPALDWARTMACFAPVDAEYLPAPMINLDMDEVCGAINPIDMADFIAANPAAFTAANCSLWGCDQCGFWNSPLDPTSNDPLQKLDIGRHVVLAGIEVVAGTGSDALEGIIPLEEVEVMQGVMRAQRSTGGPWRVNRGRPRLFPSES